jgi:shikimate dehydrogenase
MNESPGRSVRIGGSTRTVGVIGWPVDHSLSPAIHNAAFAALDLDWAYVPMPVEPGRLEAALEGLRALGFAGASVTMPHKSACADALEELSDDARLLRAVNTIVVAPESSAGHNTDVGGFERFLRLDAGFDPSGRTALVYGAGGAARACALALARGGIGALTLAARSPERAETAIAVLDGLGTPTSVVGMDGVNQVRADLVVNATPLGAGEAELPLPALGPGVMAVDLLYRPAVTLLQSAARDAGGEAYGGLGLLVHQAALAFELWTGRPAPLQAMSSAALGEAGSQARSG